MNLSVALCTYNGGRFLRDQLDSLLAQTRLPDELIVCDDASTDETTEIIQRFSHEAPFPVKLLVNPTTIGAIKNFEQAIKCCSGDLIFLCDQDDVWFPEKLSLIEAHFLADASVGLVFSDAQLVDHELKPAGRTLFAEIGFDQRKQRLVKAGRALDLILRGNYVCGATLAFRASFKELLLPIPEYGPEYGPLIHDGWMGLMIAAVGKVSFHEQPLINYRIHSGQQMGLSRVSTLAQIAHAQRTDRAFYRTQAHQMSEALARGLAWRLDARREKLLRQKIAHLKERADLPASQLQRLGSIGKEVINLHYHRFSRGWFSAAKDLLA